MGQIQGALVGIAMVLSAVFVPMAFFGGTTGAIYRQFSITIVAAMVLSVLVAMILTPALCATLLKPVKPGESHERTGFFGWFNRTFNRSASRYETFVGKILHRSLRWMLIYVLPARRDGVPVSAFADLVPAAGGSRDVHHLGPVAERQHPAADAEGGAEGGRLLPQ
ncbi:efflux RND transporter permease subunit [Klebsiella pneumoniae subsp. pneumoniae]|nr:efflux RND transporter permease subunit [Klebsiella pneumoniae subsp. pneumoniae]